MKRQSGAARLNRRRALIVAAGLVLLLSLLVSSAYVLREAAHHHDCVGADCPVCQMVAQVRQLRRDLGAALLMLLAACLALFTRSERGAQAMAGIPALCTPVGRKIRLND